MIHIRFSYGGEGQALTDNGPCHLLSKGQPRRVAHPFATHDSARLCCLLRAGACATGRYLEGPGGEGGGGGIGGRLGEGLGDTNSLLSATEILEGAKLHWTWAMIFNDAGQHVVVLEGSESFSGLRVFHPTPAKAHACCFPRRPIPTLVASLAYQCTR